MTTREEYVKGIKNKLDELNTGIIKIERRAKTVRETAKVKLQARVRYLREKRDSAFSKLQELYNSNEESWQDLKEGTDTVVNSLKTALSKTMSRFKKRKAE